MKGSPRPLEKRDRLLEEEIGLAPGTINPLSEKTDRAFVRIGQLSAEIGLAFVKIDRLLEEEIGLAQGTIDLPSEKTDRAFVMIDQLSAEIGLASETINLPFEGQSQVSMAKSQVATDLGLMGQNHHVETFVLATANLRGQIAADLRNTMATQSEAMVAAGAKKPSN
jgi:hypothetical protein